MTMVSMAMLSTGWGIEFKQSWIQGGHDSSKDTKDTESDLPRGIRVSVSKHKLMNVSSLVDMKKSVLSFVSGG